MATLTITKTYVDGTGLLELDIDNIVDSSEEFLNIIKLSSGNFKSEVIEKEKFNSTIYDNVTVAATASVLEVKDAGLTSEYLTLVDRGGPIGTIACFHTFGGVLSIPNGWMQCNGAVVNETNYDAEHGSGAYVTDGIASSAILTLNLPDYIDIYPKSAATTTETGVGAMATGGNAGNVINDQHNHKWFEYNGTGAAAGLFVNQQNEFAMVDSTSGSYNALYTTNGGGGSSVVIGEDLYSDNQLTSDIDITPITIAFIFMIKVI